MSRSSRYFLTFKPLPGNSTPKIERARAQDEPVLYAGMCCRDSTYSYAACAAHPPYPAAAELRRRCIESITNALEQPLDGLENGDYWYEADGFGFLVFMDPALAGKILTEFGEARVGARRGIRRQDAAGDATPRSLR